MKIRFILSFFLIIIFGIANCYAQTSVFSANRIYGLNPMLYNGRFYVYHASPDTKGSQFLTGPEFIKGYAKINGITYSNLLLNYDIYNQELVLKYKTRLNNMMEIVIPKVWIQAFSLGKKHFEMLSFPDIQPHIYQVIGSGHFRVLYSWKKSYAPSTSYGATNYVFTNPIKSSFLQTGKKQMQFRNNRSFVALFGPENKQTIKRYMRKNKIKVKKSSLQAMLQLISYCNNLPNK